jgi:hypothetical protein
VQFSPRRNQLQGSGRVHAKTFDIKWKWVGIVWRLSESGFAGLSELNRINPSFKLFNSENPLIL